jgi:predicted phosphodiesterase
MRVAVLSDLHANPFALDAVLADLPRDVDTAVCLGDVAIGPFPNEVIWRLRELDCPVVMGNWDVWLLDGVPSLEGEVGPRLSAQGRWCSSQLDREDRAFLRTFRPNVELALDGTRGLFFHGSPRSNTDLLLPDVSRAELDRALAGARADLFVAGHTHLQMLRRRPDSLFANVGSVGLPFSEGPSGGSMRVSRWAEYALATVDERGLTLEFRRVPYDVEEMLLAARASGMPQAEWWISCWSDGLEPASA